MALENGKSRAEEQQAGAAAWTTILCKGGAGASTHVEQAAHVLADSTEGVLLPFWVTVQRHLHPANPVIGQGFIALSKPLWRWECSALGSRGLPLRLLSVRACARKERCTGKKPACQLEGPPPPHNHTQPSAAPSIRWSASHCACSLLARLVTLGAHCNKSGKPAGRAAGHPSAAGPAWALSPVKPPCLHPPCAGPSARWHRYLG
jgi:hypothetical protein